MLCKVETHENNTLPKKNFVLPLEIIGTLKNL